MCMHMALPCHVYVHAHGAARSCARSCNAVAGALEPKHVSAGEPCSLMHPYETPYLNLPDACATVRGSLPFTAWQARRACRQAGRVSADSSSRGLPHAYRRQLHLTETVGPSRMARHLDAVLCCRRSRGLLRRVLAALHTFPELRKSIGPRPFGC